MHVYYTYTLSTEAILDLVGIIALPDNLRKHLAEYKIIIMEYTVSTLFSYNKKNGEGKHSEETRDTALTIHSYGFYIYKLLEIGIISIYNIAFTKKTVIILYKSNLDYKSRKLPCP